MAAVFLPVGLIKGSTGLFYRQFAFTLAIAIVISAVNALTLSPALCALLLKNPHTDEKAGTGPKNFKERFFLYFNTTFNMMVARYETSLHFLIRFRWLCFGALAAIILVTGIMIKKTETGYIPTEDVGFLAIAINMQPGASLERMKELSAQAEKTLGSMPQVSAVNTLTGFNFLTFSNSPSASQLFIILKPVNERGPVKSIPAIMAATQAKMSTVKGLDFFVFEFPSIPGYSNVDGLDVVLQDRTGEADLSKFSGVENNYIAALMKRKEMNSRGSSTRALTASRRLISPIVGTAPRLATRWARR